MRRLTDQVRGFGVYVRARIGRGTSAQGFYAQNLRFGDLAFDIGANEGAHTAAMLKSGARVVALEPQADLASGLERDFPAATVLALGVSDQPGEATLATVSDNSVLATLNPASLDDPYLQTFSRDGEELVRLTTLDDLIAEFGLPSFVKIDTEGLEDKVIAGLSQPVPQLLFEVRSGLAEVAARTFERLGVLGAYGYRLSRHNEGGESWVFDPPASGTEILRDLPLWGDVHAKLVSAPPP